MSKRFRQPNPLQVKYGYLHPERMDLQQMLKIKDWINRAIKWRYDEIEKSNNQEARNE